MDKSVLAEAVGLSMVGLLGYLSCRRLRLREMQLLRREGGGLLRLELRRSVEMHTHANGDGGRSYPEPVETRCLTWLVCEMPCWSRRESVGLPPGSEGRLSLLGPDECDRHFAAEYRLAGRQAAPSSRRPVTVS